MRIARLAAICITLAALASSAALAGKVYSAWVIPETLNVRSGPGADRDLMCSLSRGTKVYVTAFADNWCWAKLPDGRFGWIAEWLLQFSADKGRELAARGGQSSATGSDSTPPAWINADNVNVRSGPGTQYDSRGKLTRGTKVFIVDQRNGWYKVRTPGGYGWVQGDLLERDATRGRALTSRGSSSAPSSSSDAGGAESAKAYVTDDNVRLRSGPSTSDHIVATLTSGQVLYVVDRQGKWLRVRVHGGEAGWIHSDYVKYESASEPGSGSGAGEVVSAKGYVSGSSVHLRSGPTLNEHIKTQVVRGQTLYIDRRQGDWYHVTVHGGDEGWIHGSLVKLEDGSGSSSSSGGSSGTAKAYVTGENVRLRAGAGTSERVKALLTEGQTVYVTDRQGDWLHVSVHGGGDGWVHGSLVKYEGESMPRVSTPEPSSPAGSHAIEDLTAWIAEDVVNVRYGPSTDSDVKMKLSQGARVQVIELNGHWCKIKDSDGNTGWVAGWVMNFKGPNEQPTVREGGQEVPVRTAWVERPEVNLRSGPGTSYPEVAEATLGTQVIILDREGDWYRVALDNGKTGYMASWLLDTRAQRRARQEAGGETGSSCPTPSSGGSDFGRAVVDTARKYLGCSYSRGSAGPSSFDCSGFVHYILGLHGVEVSRDSRALFRQGTPISRDDLQVGDVVFFENTYRSGISHVGIYIGDGNFIHAANSRTGVTIGELGSSYYAPRWAGARRMR